MRNLFTRILSGTLFVASAITVQAQNVGINTTGATPSTNSILDLNTGNSNNLGFIAPSVSLTALGTFNPPIVGAATAGDVGMLVYNTNAAVGSGVGYYYWNGATWVSTSGAASAWQILGNSNIVDGTNFLGTTNNVPINFQINGSKAGRIDPINFNTFLGFQSGNAFVPASVGHDNAALGYQTLNTSSTVKYDVAVGSGALKNDNSSANTAVGYQSLTTNNTGTPNTAVGYQSLKANTTGTNNVAVGDNALATNSTSSQNTAVGSLALTSNTGGSNSAFGYRSLTTNSSGSFNTAFGFQSMSNTNTGSQNTGIGTNTLQGCSTGFGNTAIGVQALQNDGGGSNNTAAGYDAMIHNSANNNTAIGFNSMNANTSGTPNTALGYQALQTNTTGTNNVAIGDNALTTNNSGNQNTALGSGADVAAAGLTNATAIGFGAIAGQSNALILGNASAQTGIQTNTPQRALEIGGVANTARIDGLAGTGTVFNQPAPTLVDNLVYADNLTGDLHSIPATGISSYLTSGPSGLIAWQAGTPPGGSGTLNYLARWTPSGTQLGIGMVQDNNATVGINTAPVGTAMLTVTNSTATDYGIVGQNSAVLTYN